MAKKYILVSVCDREITIARFYTLLEAQGVMHQEMIELGKVPENIFDNEEYEKDSDYGFGEWCGWANNGVNHSNFDWKIIFTRDVAKQVREKLPSLFEIRCFKFFKKKKKEEKMAAKTKNEAIIYIPEKKVEKFNKHMKMLQKKIQKEREKNDFDFSKIKRMGE